jgi:ArsR family transcriptional regulator, arsenate/arsenite/antimonite-responsive transcriptional repressor
MKSADPDVLLLAALADPTRLEIVRQLGAGRGACACDFTDCCGVSQPTISHHLKVLRDAGVVQSERRGTNIYYSLTPSVADRFASIAASLSGLVHIS